mmetsp:Transcript_16547/g.23236  ORF Transcript_16547/g.23236 Transcript_16547/m.23236 type:complete len:444 (+) Transcript_16547:85-1416(+)
MKKVNFVADKESLGSLPVQTLKDRLVARGISPQVFDTLQEKEELANLLAEAYDKHFAANIFTSSQDLREKVLSEKQQGNYLFKMGEIERALASYTRAVDLVRTGADASFPWLDALNSLGAVCLSNSAACALRLKMPQRAVNLASEALTLDQNCLPAHHKLVDGLVLLGQLQAAAYHAKEALKLAPDNTSLSFRQKALEAAVSFDGVQMWTTSKLKAQCKQLGATQPQISKCLEKEDLRNLFFCCVNQQFPNVMSRTSGGGLQINLSALHGGEPKSHENSVAAPNSTVDRISGGKGYDMLKLMGWRNGQGLGRSEQGIQVPMTPKVRSDRACLSTESEKQYFLKAGFKQRAASQQLQAEQQAKKRKWEQSDSEDNKTANTHASNRTHIADSVFHEPTGHPKQPLPAKARKTFADKIHQTYYNGQQFTEESKKDLMKLFGRSDLF